MQYRADVDIDFFDDVCQPSEYNKDLIRSLDVREGTRVLEIGSGSGIVSLYCALNGCSVTAFYTDPSAVECVKRNAEKNNVQITVNKYDFKESAEGEYDVVILNFPNLATSDDASPDARSNGHTGLEPLPELIDQAPINMKEDSRIVLITPSSINQKKMKALLSDFVVKRKAKIKTRAGLLQVTEITL